MNALRVVLAVILVQVLGVHTPTARAAGQTYEIYPSDANASCNEEFENRANTLQPGDTLILHGGTYTQTCRRAITVNGTAADPIIIRAADGEVPILTRPAGSGNSYSQNNIEIVNASHLVIRGLHFKGGDIAVRFIGGHYITFEDNEVYESANNALALNSGNTDSFSIRRNHIHHTGLLDSALGTTEGEGMYVGCNGASCIASNHLIEANYIHDLRSTSGGGNDGIEVKVGSYGNVIRDNVIHTTTIGTRYPCIFVYGGGMAQNVVEGNALWNCGEAIQVVADALVRNNLILNSDVGITAAPHAQVSQVDNVSIVNNTIYGHDPCLYIRWSGAPNMVLANNALYCGGGTAVDASGLSGTTVAANYVEGALSGAAIDSVRFFAGGSAVTAFVDATGLDFWPKPGSALIGAANAAHAPGLDFNTLARNPAFDVGAYESDGRSTNPGWAVAAGFKDAVTLLLPLRLYLPAVRR